MPFISICIPAYKRTNYLKRLFASILEQSFIDFEIILTDDTPGSEVELLCKEYQNILPILYIKNVPPLGTPENWNAAIERATGDWIKIMHDDDWFVSSYSLETFATKAKENPDSFLFSAYYFVYEKENRKKIISLKPADLKQLQKDPFYLYRTNYIGNPSCTLYKREPNLVFDKRFKWVVDFEFYIRYLSNTTKQPLYISEPLICVGVNDTQVTNYTFRVANIEIPENHLMLESHGFNHLTNIFIYDYFWRLYRNLNISSPNQLALYGYRGKLPVVLKNMIKAQQSLPQKLLHFGPASKIIMFLHYIKNKSIIKN